MAITEWSRYLKNFSPANASAQPPPDLYRSDEEAVPVHGWDVVGPAEIEDFRRRGFLVVDDAYSDSDIEGATAAIVSLLRGNDPRYTPAPWGRRTGVLLRPGRTLEEVRHSGSLDDVSLARALVDFDARLARIATHPRLLAVLRAVMGDEPQLLHDMVRTKPSGLGDKPWHQDLTHFRVRPDACVVTAWISFDDAPKEAGCLFFRPGSHLGGPVKHVFDRDFQIPDEAVPRSGQVAAPVRRGSCVLLHGLVHHGSPPNRTSRRRLAVQLTFGPTSAAAITDEQRIELFSAVAGE